MLCTQSVFLFLFWHSEQFMYTTCSELVVFMCWTSNSMNNLLSYCGLVDAKISASEKDLPVHVTFWPKRLSYKTLFLFNLWWLDHSGSKLTKNISSILFFKLFLLFKQSCMNILCSEINKHLNFIGVQDAFNQSNEYQLSDCASYFLSNARRISHSGYVPSTQDILHTRVRTCGVVEVKIP